METTASIIKVVNGQIVVQQELNLFLQNLRMQVAPIVVQDRESYGEALELCKKADDAVKQVIAAAEPERLALRKQIDDLLAARDKVVAQIVSVVDSLQRNAREFNLAEKAAAKREQDRINEEARQVAARQNRGKRAENRVEATLSKVSPDLPSIPGKRIVPHWRFEVVDFSKVKREYLTIDSVLISSEIRKIADEKKAAQHIGGIRVWQE